MTRDPITDPEVLADLRRRNESERDTTRTPLLDPRDAHVERWPCRGCNTMVGVTAVEIALHAMFNRQLAARREAPLTKRALCPDCKRRDEELVAAQRRPHEQTEIPIDNPNRRRHP